MSNGILSQDELDALLNPGAVKPVSKPTPAFDLVELDAIGEISNISMGSAATALSSLIGKNVIITAPQVELAKLNSIELSMGQFMYITAEFSSGFKGSSVMMLSQNDGGIIVDLLMGGDGQSPPRDFNEIHLSAIAEVMNQMMGSAATSMSTLISKEVRMNPPKVSLERKDGLEGVFGSSDEEVIRVSFNLKVEGLTDSKMIQIIPYEVAKEMVNNQFQEVKDALSGGSTETKSEPPPFNLFPPKVETKPEFSFPFPTPTSTPTPTPTPIVPNTDHSSLFNPEPKAKATPEPKVQNVQVRPVEFAPLQQTIGRNETSNLNLILDVPIMVSVQLGKTQKTIKEILEFAPGSVVELDKLAGEAVDIVANGKLLAKGEVVVINENFGVRITEIVGIIDGKLSN